MPKPKNWENSPVVVRNRATWEWRQAMGLQELWDSMLSAADYEPIMVKNLYAAFQCARTILNDTNGRPQYDHRMHRGILRGLSHCKKRASATRLALVLAIVAALGINSGVEM